MPVSPAFQPLPGSESLVAAWPTLRRDLFSQPDSYFARTPANPTYGKPGWTRDAGKRFHGGVDIAPLQRRPAGQSVRLMFTDLATGNEYPAEAPAWVPEDEVFAVSAGVVEEAVTQEEASDFGLHVLIRHQWPDSGHTFFTLYGHLSALHVSVGQPVSAGMAIGLMGTTSRMTDARLWMAAFPHLHFEAWDAGRRRYDPLEFLRRCLPHV